VLVQEKRKAFVVDVAHIPKDVITVRWGEDSGEGWEELDQLVKDHYKSLENLFDSSDEDAPSLLGPYHGQTNVVRPPTPLPASSTTKPNPWVDVESYKGDDGLHWQYSPTSSGYESDRQFMEAHAGQPNNPGSSTDSDSSTEPPDFDWKDWMDSEDSPPPRPTSPKEFDQADQAQVEQHSPSPGAGLPTESEHEVVTPPSSQKGPEYDMVHGSTPSTELSDPGHQSSSTDSQPEDLQAALYAAKGKAKEARRIFGTARDVGDAAQRELY